MQLSREDTQSRINALEAELAHLRGERVSSAEEFSSRQAVATSEERLALALDAGGGIGTWDWDIVTDRVYSDARFAELFSIDPKRAHDGAPLLDYTNAIHPDDRPLVNDAINRCLEHGGDYSAEFRVLKPDASFRWVNARGRCHTDETGRPIHFPGVVFDVTEQKKAEIMLAEKARLAAIGADVGFALAQVASLNEALQKCAAAIVKHLGAAFARIWTLSLDGSTLELQASAGLYTHLNGPHSRIPVGSFKIGRIAEEKKPHLTNDVAHDPRIGDPEWAAREGMVAFAGYPLIVEDRLVGVLGLFSRHYLADDAMRALQSVSISIAIGIERKRAEFALRQSEERYRFLAESMPQMVWTATPDGALDYVSSQATSYFGAKEEELVGAGWLAGVHPEDRDRVVRQWLECVTTLQPYEIEFRLRRAEDGSFRWFLVRAHFMPAKDGGVICWVGTGTDIHEQKRGQEALSKANRELEEFAYVASHDLQEPLRMVNIYTQLILKKLDFLDPAMKQYATFVHQGVARMDALLHDLLSFSRNVHFEEGDDATADLAASLNDALSVLKPRIEENGASVHAQTLPKTRGETKQMSHVFQNLLSNSVKYRKDEAPQIDIRADRQGEFWIVSVKDNGIGFDPQYSERIFGLFKRLHKDEYPGTGLGLAICQRIVERYGGRMWAEGKPGEGAAFHFSLPCVEA